MLNISNARIKMIKEDCNKLRDRFLKPKIKEIRRNLYEIENKKNLAKSKIEETEKNPLELEESLSKLKKYYDYDIEFKGISDVGNLFNQSTEEDYYRPISTISVFDNKNNYIEYESKGDKNKNLSAEEYLNMIRPYLSDMINDHKTEGRLKLHSGNTVTDYKTKGEWEIQLSMAINFISSKDSNEIHIMPRKSDNIHIMMGSDNR